MKRKMKKRKRAHRLAQKGLMVVRVMMAFRKTKDSEISLEQGEEVVVVDKVIFMYKLVCVCVCVCVCLVR